MNLSELAESDNSFLVEDDTMGFADTLIFRSPEGAEYTVKGLYNSVGVDIDPETGALVPGTKVAVTARLSSLPELPDDKWKVEVQRGGVTICTGYVTHALPDRTAGRVTCLLRSVSYA